MEFDENDIESMVYKDPKDLDLKRGKLLLAAPLLQEPYFKRSALLLLDKDTSGGFMGLTLNVPTPVTLSDLFPNWKGSSKIKVYSGGPVETDRLFMLHTLGDRFSNAREIADGLYIGAELDEVIEYINAEDRDLEGELRFFIGYSGWESDQLTNEIMNHYWAVNSHPDLQDAIIGGGDAYWRREVKKLGQDYKSWLLIPQDPELN